MFNRLRSSLALPIAAAIALAIAAPAAAITNGTPDVTHENVGALLLSDADGNTIQGCTGALLAPREMLAAGHCGAIAQDLLDAGVFSSASVSFDADLNLDPVTHMVHPDHAVGVTGFAVQPGFRAGPAMSINDAGVVHLAEAVADRTPVHLPAAGALDAAAAHGGLRGVRFPVVGYGFNGYDRSQISLNVTATWDGRRRIAVPPFRSLTQSYLGLLGNASASGDGGTCNGDSGGPTFSPADGRIVVAVTAAVDPVCRSDVLQQRLDLPEVLAFLAPYTR
jgi:hypothetical protein